MNASQERYKRETPSFSSSLLDAIYRSIDESSAIETKTKRRKNFILEDGESLRRAIMIEKWMDTENRTHVSRKSRPYKLASSSSDSSCGDTFPSFEPEGPNLRNLGIQEKEKLRLEMKSTKSKATKIYSGLKKLKQPISPGRRLTNFLNSLFSSKNTKNEDLNSSLQKSRSVKDATTFTRSCLSKQPSRTNSKRSVRFYPLAVNITDDDSRACGLTYECDRGLVKGAVRTKLIENKMYLNELKYKTAFEDEDGNDDDMSCSSSDLFELENIGAIGVSRAIYTEELPVYGTTSLRTKYAIANR